MTAVLLALGTGLALVVLAVAAALSRIKVAGPNEAFVITGRKGRAVTDPATGAVTLAGTPLALGRPLAALPGGTVALALRPEAVHLGRAPGRETVLRGRITDVEFMGSVIRIGADLGGQRLSLDTFNRAESPPPAVGEEVEVSLAARDVIVLAA